jgi:hypothetical protein
MLFGALIDGLNREDWKGIAELCDPVTLLVFHRRLLQQYGQERRTLSVEEYLRGAPDLQREVAELEVARINEFMDVRKRLREDIPTIDDLTQLQSLDPTDVFARWLEARSPRGQIEQRLATGSISSKAAERALAGTYDAALLGVVPDGDQLVHLLFRSALDPSGPPEPPLGFSDIGSSDEERELIQDLAGRLTPQVLTCRRQTDGTWRIVVSSDFLGFGMHIYVADD